MGTPFYPHYPGFWKFQWSHRFCWLLGASTLFLLGAGALVTSTGSSLAVPDWPLAYGQFFPPLVGGILYEHGHRLVAALVGIITLLVALWLIWIEPRRWVKGLGLAALLLVVVQALLGGITVLYLLPKGISISHAVTGQLFFLLTALLIEVTHPRWLQTPVNREGGRALRGWGFLVMGLILLELLVGATMRHYGAGLAIPDWPLAYGKWIPALSSFPLQVHFTHRVLALLVLLTVGVLFWQALRHCRRVSLLFYPVVLMTLLVLGQALLGGLVVLSGLSVPLASLHVVVGASLLAVSGTLVLRIWHLTGGMRYGG